jgi:hypothetical protein
MKTTTAEFTCKVCGRKSAVPATPEDREADLGNFENMFSSMFAALACQPCSEWRRVTKSRVDSVVNKSFRLREGAGEKEHSLRESLRRDASQLIEAQFILFGRLPINILDRVVEQCIADPPRAKGVLLRAIGDIVKESNLPNARAIFAAGRIT